MQADGRQQQPLHRGTSRRAALVSGVRRSIGLATALGVACSGKQQHIERTAVPGSATHSAAPSATPAGSGESAGRPDGNIAVAAGAGPPGYDVVSQASAATEAFDSLVYNGLLAFRNGVARFPDPTDATVVPDLAVAAPEQPDDQTYLFRLAPGIRWQQAAPMSGRALVAADVQWHYERAIADPRSALRTDFAAIDRIETPGDGTLRITLKRPYAPFLVQIAGGFNRFILPREVGEAGKLNTILIGTGPFLLDRHDQNVRAVFKRNPDYFKRDAAGLPLPYLDGVELLLQADPGARLQQLQSRQAEISGPLTAQERGQLQASNSNDFRFQDAPGISGFIYMRLDQPPFDEQRVRQAMSLAIDRPALIQALGLGRGEADLPVPTCLGEPVSLPASKLGAAGRFYNRDVPAAKQLLAAAGYPAGLTTTLSYTPQYGAVAAQTAALMHDQLREAGIDATLRPVAYPAYLSEVFRGNFDGLAYGVRTIFADPDPYLSYYYLPGAIYYQDRSNDRDLQALIAKQQQTLDRSARTAVVNEIQRYLSDAQYRIYDVAATRTYASQRTVQNWRATNWPSYTNLETAWLTRQA